MADVLEDRLRRALREGETQLTPALDLAQISSTRGRSVVRRRRLVAVMTVVTTVALVLVGVGALTRHDERAGVEPSGPKPTVTASDAPLLSGTWAMSLRQGAPPAVPYTADTRVDLGDRVVPLDQYDTLSMVGQTVAGPVVLALRGDKATFVSEFVLVPWQGEPTVIADGLTHGVQEEAVSPDGRYFTAGGVVIDMRDLSVVEHLPDDATIVDGWIAAGLLYMDRQNDAFLWDPATGEVTAIDNWVWFPGPAGAGISTEDGCITVVTVNAPDDQVVSPRVCSIQRAETVSPDGRWLVTKRLEVVDVSTGEQRSLAAGRVGAGVTDSDMVWEDDDHVLVTLQQDGYAADGVPVVIVVRCDVADGSCERAGEPVPVGWREEISLAAPMG